jgi:hypothetical protein
MASRIYGKNATGRIDWPGRCAVRRPDEVAIGRYRCWIVSDLSFRLSALRFVILLDWIVRNDSLRVR